MFGKFAERNKGWLYSLFRVLVGLGFFMHGAQKLLGWFGGVNGGTVPIGSLFGVAGLIELVGGTLLVLGVFTRLVALVSGIEMVVAYFMIHVPNGGMVPLQNGGEAAWLFFAAFLVLFSKGNGGWSLEKTIFGKEY